MYVAMVTFVYWNEKKKAHKLQLFLDKYPIVKLHLTTKSELENQADIEEYLNGFVTEAFLVKVLEGKGLMSPPVFSSSDDEDDDESSPHSIEEGRKTSKKDKRKVKNSNHLANSKEDASDRDGLLLRSAKSSKSPKRSKTTKDNRPLRDLEEDSYDGSSSQKFRKLHIETNQRPNPFDRDELKDLYTNNEENVSDSQELFSDVDGEPSSGGGFGVFRDDIESFDPYQQRMTALQRIGDQIHAMFTKPIREILKFLVPSLYNDKQSEMNLFNIFINRIWPECNKFLSYQEPTGDRGSISGLAGLTGSYSGGDSYVSPTFNQNKHVHRVVNAISLTTMLATDSSMVGNTNNSSHIGKQRVTRLAPSNQTMASSANSNSSNTSSRSNSFANIPALGEEANQNLANTSAAVPVGASNVYRPIDGYDQEYEEVHMRVPIWRVFIVIVVCVLFISIFASGIVYFGEALTSLLGMNSSTMGATLVAMGSEVRQIGVSLLANDHNSSCMSLSFYHFSDPRYNFGNCFSKEWISRWCNSWGNRQSSN
jgi:Ca2+/Na+ antiporter